MPCLVPITRFSVCLGPIANRYCICAKNICYFLADHHRPDMPPPRLNISAESAPTHAQVPLVNVPKSTSRHYCINKYPCPTVNIMSFANKNCSNTLQCKIHTRFNSLLFKLCPAFRFSGYTLTFKKFKGNENEHTFER